MVIRPYEHADCQATRSLFCDTIEHVCMKDYTPRQLRAWQSGCDDAEAWHRSLEKNAALVAEEDGVVVGFADVAQGGYLDRLYVHRSHQRQGVGRCLLEELEKREGAISTTHASITAVPFFEIMGFEVVSEGAAERQGIFLRYYLMVRKQRISS